VATEYMRHSNREQTEKLSQPVQAPQVVKQKTSLYSKLKAGCCFIVFVAMVAGGIYLYQFYQTIKDDIDVEINKNKEMYQETKETVEKVNENYKEINAAVDQGKEYLDKAEELKDKIDGDN
jgi:uncharacterized protein HemX